MEGDGLGENGRSSRSYEVPLYWLKEGGRKILKPLSTTFPEMQSQLKSPRGENVAMVTQKDSNRILIFR